MLAYPAEAIWQEVAFLAYHLHWSLDALLDLEHADRVRLIRSTSSLNKHAWEEVRDHS